MKSLLDGKNKIIVFDWDGTLHNTKKLYAESVRKAYDFLKDISEGVSHGFIVKTERELADDSLSKYLGMTATEMWADFMPELEEDMRSQAEKIVGDSMVELVYNKSAVLYDGVTELLDYLKENGYRLLILSNCKIAYLEAHREVFGLDRWFTDYYPAQKYDFIPKEDILKQIMTKYPGDYTMIGDRANDIVAGNICGAKTIGCRYGFGTAKELMSADYIVDNPMEITPFIW